MVSIQPIRSFLYNVQATKFLSPQAFKAIKPETLRYVGDELCLSSRKQALSLEEVKQLFPTGKLEDNYILRGIKDLLSELKTDRQIIDLTPELSEKDYKMMQTLINRDNGKFIEQWKGFSDTDIVPNSQKLALFTRTMRLTKQAQDFLEFDPNQWERVFEGIIKKPKDIIMPLLEYKANSNPINIPLSEKKITAALKKTIDCITEYINMFTVKKDFIAYRGDGSFNILSGVKYEGQTISLAELMETYTPVFQDMYRNNAYNEKAVNGFIKKYIKNKDVHQARFMSMGMTERAADMYAKKIKWRIRIPKGTKGASIESFNVERAHEAEFLGQRNGVFQIKDAYYNPKEDIWYFDALLEQNPIDELIVNC